MNMYKSIFILVFLFTNRFLNTCKCVKQKYENSVNTNNDNKKTTVSVKVTQDNDSVDQTNTHRDENVNVHKNYTPVTFTGSKLPVWDYGRHGSDWTHGMCKDGFKQSPVDLHVEGLKDNVPSNLKVVYDSVLRGETPDLSYNPWKRGDIVYTYNHYLSTVQVLRSPNVFRLSVPQNEGSTFGALFTTDKPNLYVATHIDLHSPSEHTFDGSANRRQIEMQIWHYLSDSPSSDLGISSLDVPETTEVNMLITKAVKKGTSTQVGNPPPPPPPPPHPDNEAVNPSVKSPNQQQFTHFTVKNQTLESALNSDTYTTSTQNVYVNNHNNQQQYQSKNQNKTNNNNNTPKTVDLSHYNLKSPTNKEKTANQKAGQTSGHDDYDDRYEHNEHHGQPEHEQDNEDSELYYEDGDHGPSMVQLSQVTSSDEPHPLNSDKSTSYKKLLENDRYDLFNKYLLTHLNNSANNLNNEQLHVKEKKMARDKGTHWGRWAVISLTFMSEEIEKTNIESLRSFPSERFMNEVFRAGSSVNVNENESYTSVGDLNTNHTEEALPVVDLDTPLNLSSLFMMLEVKNVNYFAYDGSFTQPGCEETVRWYVAKESLPISTELMLQLHRMLNPNPHVMNPNNYVDNYRELQNVNNKCRNIGKVRFVHGYPMEYFVISPFSHTVGEVSSFKPLRISFILASLIFLISI